MAKIVDAGARGVHEFPDDATQEEIDAAIASLSAPASPAAPLPSQVAEPNPIRLDPNDAANFILAPGRYGAHYASAVAGSPLVRGAGYVASLPARAAYAAVTTPPRLAMRAGNYFAQNLVGATRAAAPVARVLGESGNWVTQNALAAARDVAPVALEAARHLPGTSDLMSVYDRPEPYLREARRVAGWVSALPARVRESAPVRALVRAGKATRGAIEDAITREADYWRNVPPVEPRGVTPQVERAPAVETVPADRRFWKTNQVYLVPGKGPMVYIGNDQWVEP